MPESFEDIQSQVFQEQKTRKQLADEKAKEGEEIACKHIASLGYRIVKRNFRFGRVGEIDIVAYEGDVLVFVEVKTRSDYSFGTPEASITPRKQAQLKRVARSYYYVNGIQDQVCRFDAIAVELIGKKVEIRHHKNAFY